MLTLSSGYALLVCVGKGMTLCAEYKEVDTLFDS